MFEAETEVVQLESRLGRVGSIQAYDPWKSRKSREHAVWWVSKIASLSYGNEAAKNPEALFKSIVECGHLSCLEFVPHLLGDDGTYDVGMALPYQSMRHAGPLETLDFGEEWTIPSLTSPASAFLVECPLYTRSQWMRHRSFSYLEMSRRYTKGSKVEWSYYRPEVENDNFDASAQEFHEACEAEYQRRLDAGWPNEIARGCMPVETMTKFWVAGFDRDWDAFLKLRNDAHAQPEIRVFAQWVADHLSKKRSAA